MKDLDIQKIEVHDVDRLQDLSRRTFFETYAAVNTEENMRMYLEDDFSRGQLERELMDPEVAFYFAFYDDEAIGYLKLNTGSAQTEFQSEQSIEIERIYVLKALHGKNIGKALCNKAYEFAEARKAPYIWLGVWEENRRAIEFYTKNGFVTFGTHIFLLGTDEQTYLLMKRVVTDCKSATSSMI